MFERRLSVWLLAAVLTGVAGFAHAREGNGRQIHVVYQGQRLGSIAKRYNVTIEAICEANGIRRRDPIHPGQRLEIPSRKDTQVKPGQTHSGVRATQAVASTASAPTTKIEPPRPVAQTSATAARGSGAPSLSKVTPSRANVSTEDSGVGAIDPVTLGSAGLSHRVAAGESLSSIAVQYKTTVKTLLQVNKLTRDQVIRVGQVLSIPKAATSGSWWGRFARAPRIAGELEVFAHTHRWKGKIIVKGKVQPAGRAALSRLLGATGAAPPIPERLIQLLAHVSDTFGGRPIRLVSGYRTNSYAKDSRHRHSSAIDFSIPGVPNSAVRDYLLQLGNVGVGYYPNSTFVHLDVRARSAYWVDYAGPGEAPRKAPRANRRLASDSSKGVRKRLNAGT